MKGETNLNRLLWELAPKMDPLEYVFCMQEGSLQVDQLGETPIAVFLEDEGATLILPKESAEREGFPVDVVFRRITLTVHSSLEAVGLTAAVANALAERGISANVIAAYHHDHVFVPANRADEAMAALRRLSASARGERLDGR